MTFKRLLKACSTGQNEVGKLRDRTQTKGCSGRIFSIVNDTPPAIDFAMHREMDAILYFLEIKNLVSKNQQSSIDRIVDEERKHFSLLSQMRKNFAETSSLRKEP